MTPRPQAAAAQAPSPRPRAWQRMLSGRRLDLLDPSPLDVEIEDIAHGLARVARWNGQTTGAHIFSVAQHTLLVEAIARARSPRLDRKRRLAVLLHDAPEYVIGDMISPFKAVIGDAYKAVEARLLAAIHLRFGLPAERTERPRQADQGRRPRPPPISRRRGSPGFAAAEARRFFGPPPQLSPAVERDYLTPWPAEVAETRFLERLREPDPRLTLPWRGAGALYSALQILEGPPMIHVCSLARLHDTVAETGARHIVTLLRIVDRVQRPAHRRRGQPSHPRHGRHHRADRRLHASRRGACRAS